MNAHRKLYHLILAIFACMPCLLSSEASAQDSPENNELFKKVILVTSNDSKPVPESINSASSEDKANENTTVKYDSSLPKNTRQVKEGYWIGALPKPENVDALYLNKVRLVITASRNTALGPLNKRLNELQMTHLTIPFGSKFPSPSKFMDVVSKFSPDQIFIHCDHGGDRSGAMIAYILVKKHNWTVPHALLAVLHPSQTDIKGLKTVLTERGYNFDENDISQYLGIYSATSNGGGGGLKVRSDDYKKLIYTFLDSIEGKPATRRHSSRTADKSSSTASNKAERKHRHRHRSSSTSDDTNLADNPKPTASSDDSKSEKTERKHRHRHRSSSTSDDTKPADNPKTTASNDDSKSEKNHRHHRRSSSTSASTGQTENTGNSADNSGQKAEKKHHHRHKKSVAPQDSEK